MTSISKNEYSKRIASQCLGLFDSAVPILEQDKFNANEIREIFGEAMKIINEYFQDLNEGKIPRILRNQND